MSVFESVNRNKKITKENEIVTSTDLYASVRSEFAAPLEDEKETRLPRSVVVAAGRRGSTSYT